MVDNSFVAIGEWLMDSSATDLSTIKDITQESIASFSLDKTDLNTLNVSGNVEMANNLHVAGKSFLDNVVLSGDISLNDTLKVGGEVSIDNGLIVGGDVSLNSKLTCLLYTSPSPRDFVRSRMPSSA